jgi:hypothetical protein
MKNVDNTNACRAQLEALLVENNRDEQWTKLQPLLKTLESGFVVVTPDDRRRGMVYCYLAHNLDEVLRTSRLHPDFSKRRRNASNLLLMVDKLYVVGE